MTIGSVQVLAASVLAGFAAAGVAWYVLVTAREITYVTLADGRRQERRLPLMFRVVLPLAPNLFAMFRRRFFAKVREDVKRSLISSGFDDVLTPEEFLSLKVLLPVVLGAVWVAVVGLLISVSQVEALQKASGVLCAAGPLWLYMFPMVWLRGSVQARHRQIRRSLPFVLDLLTLSVEAGMDFMTAMQRNVERRNVDALAEELIRVVREIQLGKTRRDSLRDMSVRVNLPELRAVVNALVQADELGVSIGSILRIQSDQIRLRRFERAERLANEAPVKMLGPLLFFIFPSVFLILMGPIIYRMMQQGS